MPRPPRRPPRFPPFHARRLRRQSRRRRRGGPGARSTIPRSRAAVDQRLEQRLDTLPGKLELPEAVERLRVRRKGAAPGAFGHSRLETHLRPQPVARRRDQALEADLALGDDRDPLAQPLGMGDDVGREDDGRSRRRLFADHMLEPALVDGVEAGEGLVEHDQLRLVDDRAEQLDRSAPCPWTGS